MKQWIVFLAVGVVAGGAKLFVCASENAGQGGLREPVGEVSKVEVMGEGIREKANVVDVASPKSDEVQPNKQEQVDDKSKRTFTGFAEILWAVPAGLLPGTQMDFSKYQAKRLDEWADMNLVGQNIQVSVRLGSAKVIRTGPRCIWYSPWMHVREMAKEELVVRATSSGVSDFRFCSFQGIRIEMAAPLSQAHASSKLKEGDLIEIKGRITGVSFDKVDVGLTGDTRVPLEIGTVWMNGEIVSPKG